MRFARAKHPGPDVEAIPLGQLRRLDAGRDSPAPLQRPDFLHLFVISSGRGVHEVDFTRHFLRRGSVLLIHPGQTHRWLPGSVEGYLVVSTAESSPRVPNGLPPAWSLTRAELDRVQRDVEAMIDEQRRYDGSAPATSLLRAMHATVVWRCVRSAPPDLTLPSNAVLEGYTAMLREGGTQHNVAAHARRLGVSTRTLHRACTSTTGRTPKQLLDDHITLEAKRLLAHTDEPVARIAARLGFREPTNFTKHFRRMEGTTPTAFRTTASDRPSAEGTSLPAAGARLRR